jgi:ABC-type spermidine/putrescine transport system permease subunit I
MVLASVYCSLPALTCSIEASSDLGVRLFGAFWKVIWLLALPGVMAGCTFTILVGGADGKMLSNLITS